MHKGIIMLVKARKKTEAVSKVREFLKSFEGDVWDWYQIGGRWQNTLAPMTVKFFEKAKVLLKVEGKDFISQETVNEKQGELHEIWRKLGGKGDNPYSDHYKMHQGGGEYDSLPLKDCIEVVKKWHYDYIKKGKETEKEGRERWLKKKGENGKPLNNYSMYGYSLKNAGAIYSQDFCFESNVFNTETYNYSLPKEDEMEKFYAVMIDIHN